MECLVDSSKKEKDKDTLVKEIRDGYIRKFHFKRLQNVMNLEYNEIDDII